MINYLSNCFNEEFGSVAEKFEVISFSVNKKPEQNVYRAGVYVFHRGDRIWKIGKHNINAYKRSFEHFRDNTGSNIGKGMAIYKSDETMLLSLFLLKEENKNALHWVLALECFFEQKFKKEGILEIPSKRI